jgi:hypothetical protein
MKRTCTRLAAGHKLIKMASTLAQQQSYAARKQVVEFYSTWPCAGMYIPSTHTYKADPHATSSFSTASFHSQGLGTKTLGMLLKPELLMVQDSNSSPTVSSMTPRLAMSSGSLDLHGGLQLFSGVVTRPEAGLP